VAYPVAGTPYSPPGTTSANPNPAYSGTFIPEIWSGKLVEKFYATTVLAAISNTNYEGEIKNQGDKVKIRTKPTITIKNYSANQTLELERPSSNIIELNIDQGRYWNTILDDVMEVQQDINQMNLWSEDAAEQMKQNIDSWVLNRIYEDIHAKNKGASGGMISGGINFGVTGTPVALDADNIINLIVDFGMALDEHNIPDTGRWIVIPAWVGALIKKSELRDASLSGDDTSMLRNGRLGRIDRFTLYSSNLLPHGTSMRVASNGDTGASGEWVILAGHSHGLTFAAQVTKTETMRSELTFGTILRGLSVFGSKVIDGTALAGAIVVPA
jgi:hypothetical protein